jgi:hypothetical protein
MIRRPLILPTVLLAAGLLAVAAWAQPPEPNVAKDLPSLPDQHDSGVTREASAELAKIYRAAAVRLKAIVLNPQGPNARSRQFRQARAAQLLAQVNQAIDELKLRSARWVAANVEQAVARGVRHGEFQARDMGLEVPKLQGGLSIVDRPAVEVLANDTVADLAKAADATGDRAKRLVTRTQQLDLSERGINRILAGGVIEGTPARTVRELRDAFRSVAGDTVVAGSRTFEASYYAEIVARTRTRQAVQVGRHERLESLGLDLVRIIGRVSGNFCTAFLGQVYSLSGNHPTYPALAELPGGFRGNGPPFHPQCSKSTAPFVEALASTAELARARPLSDAQRLRGMTTSQAQRAFRDLQLRQQIAERHQQTGGRR